MINGSPAANLARVVDLMGGVTELVGPEDVVVLKPNVQWWNQGSVNLAALQTLVEITMEREGGFRGEVVIVENCHRGGQPWLSQSSGWTRSFNVNSGLDRIESMNDLTRSLKERYGDHFSTVHLVDIAAGNRRTYGPEDGTGYVYCDGTKGTPSLFFSNGASGNSERRTIATYPIFRTDRGTLVDFRNGVWANGSYTDRPVRFINIAGLNHHSTYCGMTSCIKNYMGLTDLSGGPNPSENGQLVENIYNFHTFPFDKWAEGPVPGMIGAEMAFFMDTVRKADLNIVTAEWVGLISRVDPPITRTRCVLASTDPVALDFHSSKYLLYPNSKVWFHDPERKNSPVRQYLEHASKGGAGTLNEGSVEVVSYDMKRGALQANGKTPVRGKFVLGSKIKPILKYLLFRFMP